LQARDAQLEELKKAAGTSEELKKQIEPCRLRTKGWRRMAGKDVTDAT